ncbi:MAG: MGMT family protein [Thermoanaerobaculia bacterium]
MPQRTGSEEGCPSSHDRISRIVARIPRGRVATYGQVARLAGLPGQARLVGYALHALPEGSRVPWHRVVNARGSISPRTSGSGHDVLQRILLRREGVRLGKDGRVALAVFRWRPRPRRTGDAAV